MEYKPLPLSSGPVQERLVSAMRTMRSAFRESPFFVKAASRTSWVTDMLNSSSGKKNKSSQKQEKGDVDEAMFPDYCWPLFPKELIPLSKGGLAVSRKRKLGDSASKKRPKGN
jgi:hypothetical protein